jgi:hypothetical protein
VNAVFTTVRLSAAAVEDHLGRLYEGNGLYFEHVDVQGAVIRLQPGRGRTITIELTPQALAEFLDDLDYQIEFTDSPAYKAQCRRAMSRLRTTV